MESILTRFEAYLLTEKRVSQNTFSAYKCDIRQLVDFLRREHRTTVEDVTRQQIKTFLYFLNASGLAARSMSRKISTIKIFFSYAHTYHSWENKGDDLIFPKLEKKLPRYLSEKEIEKLLAVADNDSSLSGMRNKVMLYLMYVSGMRVTELITLKVGQIQFDSNFITVTGKGGKSRVIPIPADMMTLLQDYVDNVLGQLIEKGGRRKKSDVLFPSIYGGKIRPITRQAFWALLKTMWKKTGIEKNISPHQLRHSLATHMLKNGVDLRSLQLILGHENLSTVQIYTHLETEYLRKVYDKKHPRS